ncbi:MAG TPA: class I SAM-dependent methyltransferase [Pyrinomonadaceae bacterium]|nr:class I SAM-dependent methyltransferase [Acidobacteriota bacterium]HQZ97966.1 class I SAM-dependent methyltransferase [Pyrinomonadaceae bacterium]
MAVSERFQGANVVDAGRLSPYWGEHAARYVFALPFVENKRVLDIACGTGYGIGLLRSKAKFVTGVDIDPVAANEAKAECGENGAVLLGNGLGLPFDEATFDVITSFETLEHLHERGDFLAELQRVLTPDGTLILSTPNANYSQPVNGVPANPFHIHEYEPGELKAELEEYFTVERFLGQDLNASIKVSPFFEGQKRMPNDVGTQARLFGWKVFNKIPVATRERLSQSIWGKPFYPTEIDYNFDEATVATAVTLVAVCWKRQ